ncbi:MAG: hypothetical protein HY706_10210 [Candidatus Hydrogenedentes bacterium]|nr:hypothetical protein [Candidatus Hydrogenedentota bacterium]
MKCAALLAKHASIAIALICSGSSLLPVLAASTPANDTVYCTDYLPYPRDTELWHKINKDGGIERYLSSGVDPAPDKATLGVTSRVKLSDYQRLEGLLRIVANWLQEFQLEHGTLPYDPRGPEYALYALHGFRLKTELISTMSYTDFRWNSETEKVDKLPLTYINQESSRFMVSIGDEPRIFLAISPETYFKGDVAYVNSRGELVLGSIRPEFRDRPMTLVGQFEKQILPMLERSYPDPGIRYTPSKRQIETLAGIFKTLKAYRREKGALPSDPRGPDYSLYALFNYSTEENGCFPPSDWAVEWDHTGGRVAHLDYDFVDPNSKLGSRDPILMSTKTTLKLPFAIYVTRGGIIYWARPHQNKIGRLSTLIGLDADEAAKFMAELYGSYGI